MTSSGSKLLRKAKGRPAADVDLEEVIDLTKFPPEQLRLWQLHLNALEQHVSRPYAGRVTLFRTRGQPLFCSLEEDFGWGKLARGGVDIRLVPGSHETIFIEPAVQALAGELKQLLPKCRGGQAITIQRRTGGNRENRGRFPGCEIGSAITDAARRHSLNRKVIRSCRPRAAVSSGGPGP